MSERDLMERSPTQDARWHVSGLGKEGGEAGRDEEKHGMTCARGSVSLSDEDISNSLVGVVLTLTQFSKASAFR